MSCAAGLHHDLSLNPRHTTLSVDKTPSGGVVSISPPLPPTSMPSPRSTSAARPASPRSPNYKTSTHFDSLQLPPQRPIHSRTGGTQRRAPNGSLTLPSLPRFHPANYPSARSSVQSTPDGTMSPQPPISPRAHQRLYSDAQKQLYLHQREMLAASIRPANMGNKPASPRLAPRGSPGPVTPLELEGEEGYLLAGARSCAGGQASPEEVLEKLLREETGRQRGGGPR